MTVKKMEGSVEIYRLTYKAFERICCLRIDTFFEEESHE